MARSDAGPDVSSSRGEPFDMRAVRTRGGPGNVIDHVVPAILLTAKNNWKD
jgi:hypothetical protein